MIPSLTLAIIALLVLATIGVVRERAEGADDAGTCPDCGEMPGAKGWATPCKRCFALYLADEGGVVHGENE